MPYQLMSDEHMRDRLAAGEANRLATKPQQIVEYDRARWTRSGDMWIRDDGASAGLVRRRAILGSRSGTNKQLPGPAEPAPGDRPALDTPRLDTPRRGTPNLDALNDALDRDAADPGQPGLDETAGQGRPRRRGRRVLVAGVVCLGVASGVAAIAAVSQDDRGRQQRAAPVIAPGPSTLPGLSPDEETSSGSAAPTPDDIRSSPAVPRPDPEPTVPGTPVPGQERPPVAEPPPPAAPPTVVPAAPNTPAPPPARPAPPRPPAGETPLAAAAALKRNVALLADAGHLSIRGRTILLDRAHKIEQAAAQQKTKAIRKEYNRMLREMDDLRNKGELTPRGEDILESGVDRLKASLRRK